MPIIRFDGAAYEAAPGETVLETLLRNGAKVENSCRAGACQTCMLRAVSGAVPPAAQQGLKATLVEQGFLLSCVCRPEEDLALEPAGGLEVPATITALERLTETVMRARLRTAAPLSYRAGQYVTLRRSDGLSRSYSLASLPEDSSLELHIRRAPRGRMSGWIFDEAKEGDNVSLRGPAGDCFYTAGAPEQPLLLAGTGTGLAPLVGICRDALAQGHRGPIHIFHGALRPEGLYLQDEIGRLAAEHANVAYTPVVKEGGEAGSVKTGEIDKAIGEAHPKLNGWRSYVCGDPSVVQLLRKKIFLAGASSKDIFSDSFVVSPAYN